MSQVCALGFSLLVNPARTVVNRARTAAGQDLLLMGGFAIQRRAFAGRNNDHARFLVSPVLH